MKKLRITIENKAYDVLVEVLDGGGAPVAAPARPVASVTSASVTAVATPPPAAVSRNGGAPGDVLSPLAGKIVAIDVAVGATVTEGAQIATIEAMKMNTYIFAPKAGKVTEVLVNPGDGVQEGALLLKIA